MSDTQIIALDSADASLIVELRDDASPVWRYLGARLAAGDLPKLADTRGHATFSLNDDVPFALFPPSGLGWFGPPQMALRGAGGLALHFLPDEFSHEAGTESAEFRAVDSRSGLAATLAIRTLKAGGFEMRTSLHNAGSQPIAVDRITSALLPLSPSSREIVSWRGKHNAELAECREPMPKHGWFRETRRGISGHGGPPGLYVLGDGATRDQGLVLAAQLAWSGDSRLAVERDDEGAYSFSAEAILEAGETVLQSGEGYEAPAMLLAVSTAGCNGARQQMHGAVRSMVEWPDGKMRPRPVHLNSWEATYFAHDEASSIALIEAAAEIGIERFVLDDGWFKGRIGDWAGLGDWTPCPKKYPRGLTPVAEAARENGLEFGLWVEPEMVNPDSDLYRAHPDWVLAEEGREGPVARNQLVLDMRLPEVRDYLFDALDKVIRETGLAYLKWDHNRDHAPSGGAAQTRGMYELLRRIRDAHPDVEIEECAGGGGRSDAGMIPYVHRFWTSDTTDAVSRVAIQRGFSALLPPEIMGAHIGASPAHTSGRGQSLAFRAAVACMGHLGVELDPRRLDAAEKAELVEWLTFYKQWRGVLHSGRVHLGEGADGIRWQAQGLDDEKLLFVIRTEPAQDRRPQPLPLPFASSANGWSIQLLRIAEANVGWHPPRAPITEQMRSEAVPMSGEWLAESGLPIPSQRGESVAIYHLKAEQ